LSDKITVLIRRMFLKRPNISSVITEQMIDVTNLRKSKDNMFTAFYMPTVQLTDLQFFSRFVGKLKKQ